MLVFVRSRRLVVVLLSSLLVTLAVAVPANASISLRIPVGNPVLNPGSALATSWVGECPPGLLCGLWNYTATDPGAWIATGMSPTPVENSGVMELDAETEVGASSEQALTNTHSYRLRTYATAGQWYAVASWNECQPMQPEAVNLGTCPLGVSAVLPFRVRTMIGLPRDEGSPRMDHQKVGGRHALFMRTTFGCNAHAKTYVGSLIVHKRMKVGKRTIWRTVLSRPRVVATRNDAFSKCYVEHTWTVPRSIKRSTQLRYTWSIRSVGAIPAARSWKGSSATFAAASVGY